MVIAEALSIDPSGGKMKMWVLARDAFTKDEMEVDTADFALIKKTLETSKAYGANNIVLGQCLTLLEEMK